MDIKNIMKNVTPSITVMAVGLVGAYFVYNTYFSDKVASGYASFEPAAGEEMFVDESEMAPEMAEDVSEIGEATDMMAEEGVDETEEAWGDVTTEETGELVEDIAADSEVLEEVVTEDSAEDVTEEETTDEAVIDEEAITEESGAPVAK